jgi:uncharacterized membrane protein
LAFDWRSKAFIALSVMGVAVAVYHAYGEITFTFNACNLNNFLSCQAVFASGYTTVLGIDFWVYGVVWFPACIVVGLWAIRRYGTPLGSVVAPFLMIGNIFTLYPWYIEIRLLNGHYCPVCITLYLINYLLTFVALASRSIELSEEDPAPGPSEGGVGAVVVPVVEK